MLLARPGAMNRLQEKWRKNPLPPEELERRERATERSVATLLQSPYYAKLAERIGMDEFKRRYPAGPNLYGDMPKELTREHQDEQERKAGGPKPHPGPMTEDEFWLTILHEGTFEELVAKIEALPPEKRSGPLILVG